MKTVIFSKYAKQELEDAVRYYELAHAGLGNRFKDEVRKAVLRIVKYPQAWMVERGEVRKIILHRFPYKLLYSVEKDVELAAGPNTITIAAEDAAGKPGKQDIYGNL